MIGAWAHFPEFDYHLPILPLIFLGLAVGAMTSFWGMGGRFLMTPLLNVFFNIPYHVAVGSDICQMVGTSSMNMMRYRIIRSVDYRLAGWTLAGALGGVECGAQILEALKSASEVVIWGHALKALFLVLSSTYAVLLVWIGTIIYRESKGKSGGAGEMGGLTEFQMEVTARLHTLRLPPMISFPVSGIGAVSLWVVLGVGFLTGLLVGFLGVGGSFIVLPAFIYILGCPMGIAMSTDLFGSLFLMGYGTFSHSLKGNIDLILVMILLLSSTVGMQIGTFSVKRFSSPRVRQGFVVAAYFVALALALKVSSALGLVVYPS